MPATPDEELDTGDYELYNPRQMIILYFDTLDRNSLQIIIPIGFTVYVK